MFPSLDKSEDECKETGSSTREFSGVGEIECLSKISDGESSDDALDKFSNSRVSDWIIYFYGTKRKCVFSFGHSIGGTSSHNILQHEPKPSCFDFFFKVCVTTFFHLL